MLVNYMEVIVDNLLPEILEEYQDICKCEKCIEDIKALTLNNLKPMYVVSDKGSMYVRINELKMHFKANVMKEMILSINTVSKNPHHESSN